MEKTQDLETPLFWVGRNNSEAFPPIWTRATRCDPPEGLKYPKIQFPQLKILKVLGSISQNLGSSLKSCPGIISRGHFAFFLLPQQIKTRHMAAWLFRLHVQERRGSSWVLALVRAPPAPCNLCFFGVTQIHIWAPLNISLSWAPVLYRYIKPPLYTYIKASGDTFRSGPIPAFSLQTC